MNYLIGEKVRLVKFTERFITPKYIDWLNDPEVNRYLYIGRIPVAEKQLNDPNDANNMLFAMMTNIYFDDDKQCTSDNYDEYIGTISLNRIDWINRSCETGYCLGSKKHWGKGITTEAVGLIVDYALNRLNLHKVVSGVVDGHDASIRVLEKNGFKEYGKIPEDYYINGEYRDTHRFYRTKGM
jgi:ribosomal-protein-alanine N-acetyltransferase